MHQPRGLLARATASSRQVIRELSAFSVVGAANFVLEIATYQFMYGTLHQGALVSKVASTTVTATTAYFMHRYWSFAHRERSGFRREYTLFVILSVASLIAGLVLIGAVRYGLGRTDLLALQIANVASIVLGSAFRFWAYRRWVFRAPVVVVVVDESVQAAPA